MAEISEIMKAKIAAKREQIRLGEQLAALQDQINGAVQAPQVEIDEPFFIELELQRFQNGINPACILPTPEGVVDRIPWSETFWKVSPRSSGVEYPENAIEHLARFTGRAPDQASRRKLGLDKPPLCISQLITAGHGMDLKLLRRCEIISSSL